MITFKFQAIGTSWTIDILEELDAAAINNLKRQITERIDVFDRSYSRFRSDSLVTTMSKKAGSYELPNDAEPMMALYLDLYTKTDGLVTPLIGNLISDAGYDANYSLRQKDTLASPPSWSEAIEYRAPILTVKKPVLLDFGAAGKGYLVDLVGEVIESAGISEYSINAGGDIISRGKSSISVGLENPFDVSKIVGVAQIKNQSICGSAGNRRAWENFTHIIDPKKRLSPIDIAAVWTVADTALIADGLSTCLFFVSPDILRVAYRFEYAIMYRDQSVQFSLGFPGNFFD